MENIIQKIKSNRGKFTKQQAKIASFLVSNRDKAAFLSTTQLSAEIGVSQPTVIRFAQSLGFSNYSKFMGAFQELLKEELTSTERLSLSLHAKEPSSTGNFEIISQEMHTLDLLTKSFPQKEFHKLVKFICNGRQVFIVGTRGSSALAQFFSYFLSKVKRKVVAVTSGASSSYDLMLDLNKEDIIIGIAFPRYPRETSELISFASAKGAKVVGITDKNESPLAKMADFAVTIPITFSTIFDSYCSALCLFNMIVTEVGRINRKESEIIAREFEELAREQKIFLPY
jgi:DNA-binding MurR/RpiR family transcriptional regulator